MNESEISWKERDRLYKLSAIPFLIVVYAFIAYVVYLMRTNPLRDIWDFTVRVGLPSSVIGSSALFSTFEVLYHRKSGRTATFHIKRFAHRAFFVNVGVLSFLALIIIFNIAFSDTLGEKNATLLGFGICAIIFLIVALKLGKRSLRKVLEQA